MEHNIDYKQLAIDCGELAIICQGADAESFARHERACRDAIFELLRRAEAAEKRAASAEYRCGEEIGRRKAMEIRAERAEARCARLEGARENANEAAAKWEGRCKILDQRLDTALKLLRKTEVCCNICIHTGEPAGRCYDGSVNGNCGLCKADDCHCRGCKDIPEGRSNWQFAGWYKVLQEG